MSKRLEDRLAYKNPNYLLDSNFLDRKKSPFNFNIYERQSPADRKSTDSAKAFNYNSSYYQRSYKSPEQFQRGPTFLPQEKQKRFQSNQFQQHSFQYIPKQQFSSMHDPSSKRNFYLKETESRRQSPTIFKKKQSYADQINNSLLPFFSPKNDKPQLIKNASDYIPNHRPFTSLEDNRIQNKSQQQKFQAYVPNQTKFDIERLRMELELYKRNNKSRINDGPSILKRDQSHEQPNTFMKRDVSPKLNFNYIKNKEEPKRDYLYKPKQQYQQSPERNNSNIRVSKIETNYQKKQPFQLQYDNGMLSNNKRSVFSPLQDISRQERRITPETNRVEELRKQLYSTYKPKDRDLFFESLNKSTPYNKIANEQYSREKEQIKYKLDKKFM